MDWFLRKLLLVLLLCGYMIADGQLLTWSPQFPTDNSTLVITVDATRGNQGLLNYANPANIYVHCGVTTNLSNNGGQEWRYVNGSTGGAYGGTTPALKATSLGNNRYQYTINNIRAFFGVPAGETIRTVNILFRDANADAGQVRKQANADGSDMFIPVYPAGQNRVQITQPFIIPTFNIGNEAVTPVIGQPVPVTATASTTAGTLNLYFNGARISGPVTGTSTISGNPVVTTAGNQQIIAELIVAGTSYFDSVQFYLPPANTIAALPPGVREGINYWPGCDSVTLVLFAPNKTNAVVLGDFANNNWVPQAQFQMNKTPDGNYYWLTIRGLTAGTEYAFEYLVDNTIYIADPYSEKVLDPWNDPFIPAVTYPGLKPYPSNPAVAPAVNGIVSVLQTCAPAYNWQVNNFAKPDKRNLVIYELLVRDFGDARNYQMLIDTISYFKRMGINAIELMPVNEFSGNESWGYNPVFYLALDKAYGTKTKFKEFIDLCHKNGIAVILDVVYNQLDAYNAPEGKLYWDAINNRPAANNPWLNPVAPHPYSVFNDLNHTSTATQNWVKRALEYWVSEYRIDGYRIDLAKGFTQTVSNEGTVENFDGSRVDNLFRYYDHVISLFPDTYMILEFLGQQRFEEQLYANKGFLLWGNSNPTYNQNTMGYADNSDFSKVVYNSSQEAFTVPANIGYMESHDEERMMYRNLQYGNSSGTYNVKNLATALERQAAAAALFFTIPGPKMIWQFGERGYDTTINFGGRTGNKPPLWNYMANPDRLKLWNAYSSLINLRLSNPAVFNSTSFTYDFTDNGGLFRRFQIADSAATGMRVTVVANMDVVPQTRPVTFQTAGAWYNYLANGSGTGINGPTGSTLDIATPVQNITLQPGEYHVYIYQPASVYTFTGNGNWNTAANWSYNRIPPSPLPSGAEILINPRSGGECILNVPQTISPGGKITVVTGKNFRIPLNLTKQ